ncbi:MAG: IgGFc-binding protein, partial [Bacteroidota bacterium]
MRKYLFCLFIVLVQNINISGQSNEGTQFAFAFMEHRNRDHERVAIITARNATRGVVEVPGQGWSQTFEVAANGFAQIDLPAFTETVGSENIEDNGVFIQAEDTVSAYIHQFFDQRSDASLLLPFESLGNAYYVMTFRGLSLVSNNWPSEFLVVAITDNTEIEITPAANTVGGQTAGDPFTITLQRGQSYQVQAALGIDDLTGSYLQGNKPFSLFAGAQWTNVPANCGERDNLMEQM